MDLFDIPSVVVFLALGISGLLAGGVWLIRIARSGGDEGGRWRYRDR